MRRTIMLIDLNAFFITAEEIKVPSLIGKPTAIGRLGRGGIVSTCSYAARKYGVHSGMPSFQAVKLCPNLIFLRGNYQFYEVLSNSFYFYLSKHFKIIERASVDECFVDITQEIKGKTTKETHDYLRAMQNGLLKEVGLKSSIGLGPTRFLAKMASELRKPMGLSVIRVRDIPKLLYPLPIGEMHMVGKRTSAKLLDLGIKTIGDFKQAMENNGSELAKVLGRSYEAYYAWLNGRGNDIVDPTPWDPKSVSHSTTLSEDTTSSETIKEVMKLLSKEVANEVKKDRKKGYVIQITLKDDEFRSFSRQKKIKLATNEWEVIYRQAVDLLNELYDNERPIRLVGVALAQLINRQEEEIQMTFYDYMVHEEEMRTKLLINEINRQLKKPVLKQASALKSKKIGEK